MTPVTHLDLVSVAVAVFLTASLITAITVIWKPVRRGQAFADLVTRELTGWEDPATGEQHPSLRAEIRDLSSRLGVVEQATRQLRPNGGTHLYDAIHRLEVKADLQAERVAAVEGAVEALKPRSRARKPKDAL